MASVAASVRPIAVLGWAFAEAYGRAIVRPAHGPMLVAQTVPFAEGAAEDMARSVTIKSGSGVGHGSCSFVMPTQVGIHVVCQAWH
jgi:hypothetical protein